MAEWVPSRLPEDIDAERAFLATCCAPGAEALAAECCLDLSPEIFVHPGHQAVFRALVELLDRREEVHSLSLKQVLEDHGTLNRVGGYPGLVELLAGEDVGRPQRLVEYLTRKARWRKLVHLGTSLVRRAASEDDAPEVLVDETSQALSGLVQTSSKGNLAALSERSDEWLADMLDRAQGRRSHGLRVGFPRLDHMTQGFQPGHLVVLAARPGIGKTALALNWLLRVGRQGKRGAFFSLEMSFAEVFSRLVADEGHLNIKDAVERYDPDVFDALAAAKRNVEQLPIWIGDRATITVREIRAQVERQIARHGSMDFVVVDYLQLISSPPGGSKQNEAVRIGEMTRGLKLMAKDLQIPVVLLSQLNREVEHRTGGRPQLSDLRDSGSIEQDADIVAFIHRKMQALADGEVPDATAELIIAKHRGGPLGLVNLRFEAEQTRYVELSRETHFQSQSHGRHPADDPAL